MLFPVFHRASPASGSFFGQTLRSRIRGHFRSEKTQTVFLSLSFLGFKRRRRRELRLLKSMRYFLVSASFSSGCLYIFLLVPVFPHTKFHGCKHRRYVVNSLWIWGLTLVIKKYTHLPRFFENWVSKDKDSFYYLAIKTIEFVQRPIKSLYVTPESRLMIPRSSSNESKYTNFRTFIQ